MIVTSIYQIILGDTYYQNMKKTLLVFSSIVIILSTACGPSIKTKKIDIPQSPSRGAISIQVKPGDGIAPADAARVKHLLSASLNNAGFNSVSLNGARSNSSTSLDLVVTVFEHSSPSNNNAVVTGVGCAYVCSCFAPCLLLRGYNEPQLEITVEASAKRAGRMLFEQSITERAQSSSNLLDRGSAEFKRQLEELAVHNLTAAIVAKLDNP